MQEGSFYDAKMANIDLQEISNWCDENWIVINVEKSASRETYSKWSQMTGFKWIIFSPETCTRCTPHLPENLHLPGG